MYRQNARLGASPRPSVPPPTPYYTPGSAPVPNFGAVPLYDPNNYAAAQQPSTPQLSNGTKAPLPQPSFTTPAPPLTWNHASGQPQPVLKHEKDPWDWDQSVPQQNLSSDLPDPILYPQYAGYDQQPSYQDSYYGNQQPYYGYSGQEQANNNSYQRHPAGPTNGSGEHWERENQIEEFANDAYNANISQSALPDAALTDVEDVTQALDNVKLNDSYLAAAPEKYPPIHPEVIPEPGNRANTAFTQPVLEPWSRVATWGSGSWEIEEPPVDVEVASDPNTGTPRGLGERSSSLDGSSFVEQPRIAATSEVPRPTATPTPVVPPVSVPDSSARNEKSGSAERANFYIGSRPPSVAAGSDLGPSADAPLATRSHVPGSGGPPTRLLPPNRPLASALEGEERTDAEGIDGLSSIPSAPFARPKPLNHPQTTPAPPVAPIPQRPSPVATPLQNRQPHEAVGSEFGPPKRYPNVSVGGNTPTPPLPPSSERMVPGSGSSEPIVTTAPIRGNHQSASVPPPPTTGTFYREESPPEPRIVTGYADNDQVMGPPPPQTLTSPPISTSVGRPPSADRNPSRPGSVKEETLSPPPPPRSETIGSEQLPRDKSGCVPSVPGNGLISEPERPQSGLEQVPRTNDETGRRFSDERERVDSDPRRGDTGSGRREREHRDRDEDRHRSRRYEEDEYARRDRERYERDEHRDKRRDLRSRTDYYPDDEFDVRSSGRRSVFEEDITSSGGPGRSDYYYYYRDGRRRDYDRDGRARDERDRYYRPDRPEERERPYRSRQGSTSENPELERSGREPRDRDPRDPREYRDPRDARDPRDPRDHRDARDPRYDAYRRNYDKHDPRGSYYRPGYDYYGRGTYDQYRYPYGAPYDYEAYKYNYAYWEQMKKTNPAAYADWYQRTYGAAAVAAAAQTPGRYPGHTYTASVPASEQDRASVHSGRSSVNDDMRKERYSGDFSRSMAPLGMQLDQSTIYPDPSLLMPGYEPNLTTYTEEEQDLTPHKFASPHVIGRFTQQGRFMLVPSHDPRDPGQPQVELYDLKSLLLHWPELQEFEAFPGPLVSGQTHKHNVIQFCQHKVKQAQQDERLVDRQSYTLIWELLMLLIRQNGTVVGADIAELLLGNETTSQIMSPTQATVLESTEYSAGGEEVAEETSVVQDRSLVAKHNEKSVTETFRQHLLYGHKKEALEWAMREGLWGHALFLASKMDNRTYSSVLSRFANGLTLTDPLQTLYQLMSGRQPAAVTCVGEEKWGDWRPHLAMMLSNTSSRPDLDKKSILAMGDTLLTKNLIYAAQFCYLMGQLDWATYGKQAKLVLLTGNAQLPFKAFVTNEAIQCTEVYEFARQLATPDYHIPHFQWYKYIYACRLLDLGMATEALHYCEVLSRVLCAHPSAHPSSLADQVHALANGLKHLDPLFQQQEGQEGPLEDPKWLQDLALLREQQQAGLVSMEAPSFGSTSNLTSSETGDTPSKETVAFVTTNILQPGVAPPPNLATLSQDQQMTSTPQPDQPPAWQSYPPSSLGVESQYPSLSGYQQPPEQQQWGQDQSQQQMNQNVTYDQNAYWNSTNQWNNQSSAGPEAMSSPYWGDNTQTGLRLRGSSNVGRLLESSMRRHGVPQPRPLSIPTTKPLIYNGTYPIDRPELLEFLQPARNFPESVCEEDQEEEENEEDDDEENASSPYDGEDYANPPRHDYGNDVRQERKEDSDREGKGAKESKENKSRKQAGVDNAQSGWFGGLFNKFSLKPKNQMKLPDDKKLKIVYDDVKKKWINTDEEEDEISAGPAAPPKDNELMKPAQLRAPMTSGGANLPMDGNPVGAPPPPGGNLYKLPKGRGLRPSYVDVLNPGGGPSGNSKPANGSLTTPFGAPPVPSFFVPPPVPVDQPSSMDFITPAGPSASLSPNNDDGGQHQEPAMFNPSQFANAGLSPTAGPGPRRRYPH